VQAAEKDTGLSDGDEIKTGLSQATFAHFSSWTSLGVQPHSFCHCYAITIALLTESFWTSLAIVEEVARLRWVCTILERIPGGDIAEYHFR
tara:strand:+ start:4282 stop:4554 length:273 start_codon:yes stop_codon:yes gene_type:complete